MSTQHRVEPGWAVKHCLLLHCSPQMWFWVALHVAGKHTRVCTSHSCTHTHTHLHHFVPNRPFTQSLLCTSFQWLCPLQTTTQSASLGTAPPFKLSSNNHVWAFHLLSPVKQPALVLALWSLLPEDSKLVNSNEIVNNIMCFPLPYFNNISVSAFSIIAEWVRNALSGITSFLL